MLVRALVMVSSTSCRADPSGEKPTCTLGVALESMGSPSRAARAMAGMGFRFMWASLCAAMVDVDW
jgi:hypothetical protein